MMPVSWADRAWEDYQYWASADRTILLKINTLLEDISLRPFVGLGKPEPLKHNWRGWWSRQITREHRLVYRVKDGRLEVAQCRFHYSK